MYTYSKLKELLIGKFKNLKGTSQLPSGWTPNAVKAIFIGTRYIFIAYHIKQPDFTLISEEEVFNDFKMNGSNGSLGNLLKQRQLSCMEEIYVDSAYQNCKGLMNLEEYISTLINSASRLRYYGYFQGVPLEELIKFFSEAQMNQKGGYTYAGDERRRGKVQYETVQNPNWYTKYNLRPDKYPIGDADGGALAKYFKRIEGQIEEEYRKKLTAIEHEGIAGAMVQLYNQDVANLNSLNAFFALNNAISKEKGCSVLSDGVLKAIGVVRESLNPVRVNQTQLVEYLKDKAKPNKLVLDLYGKYFKVFVKESSTLKLEDLVKRVQNLDGLSGFTSAVYSALVKLVTEAGKSHGDLYIMLFVVFNDLGYRVNDGDFLSVLKAQRSHANCAEFCVSILMGLCGYNMGSLKKYSRRA